MIIGITGGTGSGKTTLLKLLQDHGFLIADCDQIYHRLLKTDPALLEAITDHFPGTVTDGILDRQKLGALVFSDKAALDTLNRITHKAVKAEVTKMLTPPPALAAIDAIGLFESGLNELCKLTIAVTAPTHLRITRLMARDNISQSYARARIEAQRSQEEFENLCDYTLVNDGTEEAFREKCLAFLTQLGIINL